MKLASLKIQNFRGIRNLELDFRDELGRIQDLILIVGPNGSGKTSILDAIWVGLTHAYIARSRKLRTDPRYMVTTGEQFGLVEYHIVISDQERALIEKWKQELNPKANVKPSVSIGSEAQIVWTIPQQPDYINDQPDQEIIQGRTIAREIQRRSVTPVQDIELVGGVYYFGQERQIIAEPVRTLPTNGQDATKTDIDIRSVLVDWGIKDKLGQISPEKSLYRQIQQSYNFICAPHTMGEVYAEESEGEYEIEFFDETGQRYYFDGLSSGERSVLNFMVQYFLLQLHNSIVLIDELEMYLHPTWQRRVLQNFQRLQDGNQYIITTHSSALRQVVSSKNTIELGALDDIAAWQFANTEAEGQ